MQFSLIDFAFHLDCAAHSANTTSADIKALCEKVIAYGFHSAYLNPEYVNLAHRLLAGKRVVVGTVIAFPLGQDVLAVKKLAIQEALAAGADELDIVLNVGAIKEHRWQPVADEMAALVATVKNFDSKKIIKCIPETGYLTADEIKKVAELMVVAGVDFFKTCSGMGPRGATVEDVRLVKEAVGDAIKIKVAGGIVTCEQALSFIQAGAVRIGTSHAVEILEGFKKAQ